MILDLEPRYHAHQMRGAQAATLADAARAATRSHPHRDGSTNDTLQALIRVVDAAFPAANATARNCAHALHDGNTQLAELFAARYFAIRALQDEARLTARELTEN